MSYEKLIAMVEGKLSSLELVEFELLLDESAGMSYNAGYDAGGEDGYAYGYDDGYREASLEGE